ncbi:IclR family transcriptional regulator [Nonomuraea aurantiaca]|uniref:IclR family transcriptional regulator n=1 Tax=Nonomuraea aurantiaca TaxID=2878562 RepID=UPI001CD979C8|nr:IclR family transcriptional regulator [Nonomuraea aurantiaca]MCA2222131.1 IclR family transcriptional regulator [Nonomuraea aurantiaca]
MGETIQSVERAAGILRLLASGPRELGVAELARAMGLPKGTLHGILRTLVHVGFVEQDAATGRYRLGGTLLHLGSSYLDVNVLRTRSLNWADALAGRSRESVWIGTAHEGGVLVVHHVFRPDDSMQVLQVGTLLPAHATALGKVLMAYDPYGDPGAAFHAPSAPEPAAAPAPEPAAGPGTASATAAGTPSLAALGAAAGGEPAAEGVLAAFTPRTLTSADDLAKELELVRGRGWAYDVEELVEGEVSIAAPIRDARGVTVGAIGVRGAVERLAEAGEPNITIVSYVRDAARAITRDLSR